MYFSDVIAAMIFITWSPSFFFGDWSEMGFLLVSFGTVGLFCGRSSVARFLQTAPNGQDTAHFLQFFSVSSIADKSAIR